MAHIIKSNPYQDCFDQTRSAPILFDDYEFIDIEDMEIDEEIFEILHTDDDPEEVEHNDILIEPKIVIERSSNPGLCF